MKKTISANKFQDKLLSVLRMFNVHKAFLFFLVAATLYGFIIWRINVLVVSAPAEEDVEVAQQGSKIPVIDQAIINKMQNLKDNSVSVQALFEEARNNPFNE